MDEDGVCKKRSQRPHHEHLSDFGMRLSDNVLVVDGEDDVLVLELALANRCETHGQRQGRDRHESTA